MIRRILTFFILLLTLILTSCEHKELKFPETVKFRSLRVVLKWEQLADFQKPEGMRVIFFPLQGKGDPWIFDFPHGEDRTIELPATTMPWRATTMMPTAFCGRILTVSGNLPPIPAPSRRLMASKPASLLRGCAATIWKRFRSGTMARKKSWSSRSIPRTR